MGEQNRGEIEKKIVNEKEQISSHDKNVQNLNKREKLVLLISKTKFTFTIYLLSLIILILGAIVISLDPYLKNIISGTLIIFGITLGITNVVEKESIEYVISSIGLLLLILPIIPYMTQNRIFQPISIFNYLTKIFISNEFIQNFLFNLSYFLIFLIIPSLLIVSIKKINRILLN